MTAEQHRRIGAILGFPACCVEAWVANPSGAALRRGTVIGPPRSNAERERMRAEACKVSGKPSFPVGYAGEYVPCEAHMHGAGWMSYMSDIEHAA